MQSSSIKQIDRAALTLLQALAEHREALAIHFEPCHLEGLEADLTTLRQALLGLQVGGSTGKRRAGWWSRGGCRTMGAASERAYFASVPHPEGWPVAIGPSGPFAYHSTGR